MNKIEMIKAIEAKVNELDASIEAMKNNVELSLNTVRTQTYQRTHEIHNLMIMAQLLEGKELTGDVAKWFESAVTLTSVRKSKNNVEFHDGDNIMAIMDEHSNINYKKLKEMLTAQGFHLDGQIVRK